MMGSENITIPKEFQSKGYQEGDGDNDNGCLFQSLFSSSSSDDESINSQHGNSIIEKAVVGPYTFKLKCPPDKGTLFAHKVWSGSKYLSSYLIDNQSNLLKSQNSDCLSLNSESSVVEFGAGTALPSLVSISVGCSYCVISDYPDDDVLQSLRETVGMNYLDMVSYRNQQKDKDRNIRDDMEIYVKGYEWGKEVDTLLHSPFVEQGEKDKEAFTNKFDIALLSECLWLHNEHGALAYSVYNSLKNGGIAILTYAHHIPGKEKEDDDFFVLCREKYGMIVEHEEVRQMPYMWDPSKPITIHLKVIRKS